MELQEKIEATASGSAKYLNEDFRVYRAERTFCAAVNAYMWSQLCEELVDGRWEPFVSIHRCEPKF